MNVVVVAWLERDRRVVMDVTSKTLYGPLYWTRPIYPPIKVLENSQLVSVTVKRGGGVSSWNRRIVVRG